MQKKLSLLLKNKLESKKLIIDKLKAISSKLKREDKNILSIYLFGSYSRADFSFYSDADLIVILRESNERMIDRIQKFLIKFLDSPVSVDVIVYTKKEVKENKENYFIREGLKGVKLA